eukprot:1527151-Pyramimonas_sp.AAC.2
MSRPCRPRLVTPSLAVWSRLNGLLTDASTLSTAEQAVAIPHHMYAACSLGKIARFCLKRVYIRAKLQSHEGSTCNQGAAGARGHRRLRQSYVRHSAPTNRSEHASA